MEREERKRTKVAERAAAAAVRATQAAAKKEAAAAIAAVRVAREAAVTAQQTSLMGWLNSTAARARVVTQLSASPRSEYSITNIESFLKDLILNTTRHRKTCRQTQTRGKFYGKA